MADLSQLWQLVKDDASNESKKWGNSPKLMDLLMRDRSTHGIRDYAGNVQQRGATLAGLLQGREPTDAQKALFNIANPGTEQGAMDLGMGMVGSLKPGKYPPHMWNIKGNGLKDAIANESRTMPDGTPDTHQEDVKNLIDYIKSKGLLPATDVDKGGSVYVSALTPAKNASGSMAMAKTPVNFGRKYESSYGTSTEPYQIRFSDHGQYYDGPVMSLDPLSGNNLDTAKQYLDYILGHAERPDIGKSRIIPQLGEQYGSAMNKKAP